MSTNSPKCPVHKENEKRSEAKLRRGFGKLAIGKSGMSEIEWCRKHDPLYQVKGKERYARLHQC